MKLLQITDSHLVAPGETLYGLDPAQRLADTLRTAAADHPDAAAILLTGDLADTGDPQAYRVLRTLLHDVDLPVHLMLGNHDSRIGFVEVFGTDRLDANGFLQAAFRIDDHWILLLDTLDEDGVHGSLAGGRLDWLDRRLAEAGDAPVLLFMHHPPSILHTPNFRSFDLRESEPFLDLVARHGNVRHMAFGHMHLSVSGSLRGIPFSVSRGTCQHIVLDLAQNGRPDFVAAAPAYDLLLVDDGSVVVHRIGGLDRLPVIRPADPK